MENKVLLVEKIKGEKVKYYTSEFSDVKSVVNEIVYNRLGDLFSGDDQIGPELLKREDIEGYITHTSMCYGNEGVVCEALNNLKDFVNDFLTCNQEEKLQYYISLFNEKVLSLAGINVEFEIFVNYENEFESRAEKLRFEYLLDNLLNVDEISEFTYMLWSYQSNYSIGAGGWYWSNSLENMKLLIKHKVLYFMLDVCDIGVSFEDNEGNYGIYKLINSLVKVGNDQQKNILHDIENLLYKFDNETVFDKIWLIVDEISSNLSKLNVKNEMYLFKGTNYSRILVKEHGFEFDENNLLKTFSDDVIC